MLALTDKNYKEILNALFEKNRTAVCVITPSLSCKICMQNGKIVKQFTEKHTDTDMSFFYVDYTQYDILQNYYKLNLMNDYPKCIVFYGNWEDKDFFSGLLTVEKLDEILQKSKDVAKK